MAELLNPHTSILLGTPRSYLITPEGSQCPIKLSEAQRTSIAAEWHRVQNIYRIGSVSGTLYSRPKQEEARLHS